MGSAAILFRLLLIILSLTGLYIAELTIIFSFRSFLVIILTYSAPILNPSLTLTSIDPLLFLEARKKG